MNQEYFEIERFFEPNSEMQDRVAKKIREVVARLFKDTDLNLDDFYFSVVDQEVNNAWYERNSGIVNGKHGITVTRGLIENASRTEIFAAVIAHETGHHIWNDLIGGKNSRVQERYSDIKSVGLMERGGWNPQYVTKMQNEILIDPSKRENEHKEIDIGVHGPAGQRETSADDTLSGDANQKGYFASIEQDGPDTEWQKFQEDVKKIYAEYGYDTFLDKQLKDRFKTKDLKSIKRIDVLKFFEELSEDGNSIIYGVRFADLKDKLSQFDFTNKSEEEIETLQNIFLNFAKPPQKYPYFSDKDNVYEDMLKELLRHFKLKSFGPFQEQYENIDNLIKNYDNETKVADYAKKIKDLSWTVHYWRSIEGLTYPSFKPLGEKNKGKMLPWVQLKTYKIPEVNDSISGIYNLVTGENFWSSYYSRISDYNPQDYFVDDDNIVRAYGEEARRMNTDYSQTVLQERFEAEKKENLEKYIPNKKQLFENFMRYIKGEINVIEFFESIDVNFDFYDTEFIDKIFHTHLSTWHHEPIFVNECSEYYDVYDEIKKSDFYKFFIKGSPEVDLYPDLPKGTNPATVVSVISSLFVPSIYSKFNDLVLKGILKIADDLTNSGKEKYQKWAKEIYRVFFDRRNVVEDISRYNKDMLEHMGWDPKQIEDMVKKREQARDKIVESNYGFGNEINKHAINNPYVTLGFEDYIKKFVESELEKKSDSESIVNMLKSIGLTRLPKTEMELINAMSYLNSLSEEEHVDHANLRSLARGVAEHSGGDNGIMDQAVKMVKIRSKAPSQNVTQLMFVLWAQYFKSGYKCHPLNLIEFFKNRTNENIIGVIREIFFDGIKFEDFKSLKLMDKLKIYEFMDTRKLFSEKHANRNLFIKNIVDDLLTQKDKKFVAIGVIQKILTRHSVTEYGKPIYDSDFEFADEREKMIKYYVRYCADTLGRDDGSDEYLKRVEKLVNFITSESNGQRLFSDTIAKQLLDSISTEIVAQEHAAKVFGRAVKLHVDNNKITQLDYIVRGVEAMLGILARTPEHALATIRFLNNKLTDESIETLINSFGNEKNDEKFFREINKESLTIAHENFWGANLALRALLMERLLISYAGKENMDKKILLVANTYFKPDSPYYKDALLVLRSFFEADKKIAPYEVGLLMAALLSAGQNEDGSGLSNGEQVGRGLKLFFQTKGGAYVKFGQLLSYLPTLDSDIRKELATLRDRANIPTRDEIFEIMRNSLPESEMQKISYVGKVLGGGSIYLTVHVKYDGQDCVIALMRPHTRHYIDNDGLPRYGHIDGGLQVLSDTIDKMAAGDKKFEPLRNIVAQAKQSCASEIDIDQDHAKYTKAVRTYESLRVHTPTADYTPDVARWITYGCDSEKNNAYKIMEMAPGESLTSMDLDETEKHDMAMAYTALELSMLLSGVAWDTDRHQGQQNFYHKSFRDFCIGIFDTGAQMDKDPEKIDKIMLGHLFYELIRGARAGKGISEILNSRVKRMDSVGKFLNLETSYIDGVQRGIIALSDIIEYQKEIKDADGHVIQESKSLTEQDLQDIIVAVMDSGVVDRDVMKTIKVKGILNKLRVLRPGWFKTLGEGIGKTSSRISIERVDGGHDLLYSKRIVKAKEEIESRIRELNAGKHLGVDTDLIAIENDDNRNALDVHNLERA